MSSLTIRFSDHHGPIATMVLDHASVERLAQLVATDETFAPQLSEALADWRSCASQAVSAA